MPAQQTRVLEYQGLPVHVTWRRTSKVRLRVASDGDIRVSMPYGTSQETALRMVRLHWDWVMSHRNRALARDASVPPLRTGESVPLWGQPLEVVVSDGARAHAVVSGERIHLTRPAGDQDAARRALESLHRRELEPRVSELIEQWAPRVGRRPVRVSHRRMKTRWGSCRPQTGSLTFNTALAEKDPALLEFVVVHELVHLRSVHHDATFYAWMDRLLPGHRELRDRLKGDL